MSYFNQQVFDRFLSFRRIPLKVVAITALASYILQLGAITMGQPIYIIAIYTLLPWIPLVLFEGSWKFKHYNYFAVFAVITALQVGHLGEHAFQVVELRFLGGVLTCPPPKDTAQSAALAMDPKFQPITGAVRPQSQGATGKITTRLVQYDSKTFLPKPGATATLPACGVFGQFDFEPIHLVWDTLVWFGALFMLTKFTGNKWLWVAMFAASFHEVEHLYLGYIYFFDKAKTFQTVVPMWATFINGSNVKGVPVGPVQAMVDFYHAGGNQGVLGQSGFIERGILNSTAGHFLFRPYLHFIYNSLVVIPTVIAFITQARHAYDEYLHEALPALTPEQLVATSSKLVNRRFTPGTVIVQQGEAADTFYIITRGQAEVVRAGPDGIEQVVNRLGPGQYFGEIGLLHGGKRIATVRAVDTVEVLALDRQTFSHLMDESEVSRAEMDRIVRQRVVQVRAMEGAGSAPIGPPGAPPGGR